MKFAYANICNNPDMPDRQVAHDIGQVGQLAGLIGWQEIGEQQDHDTMAEVLPAPTWQHLFTDTAVPISVKTSGWRVGWTKKVQTHGGRAKVTPDRWIVAVMLTRVEQGRPVAGKKLLFMNTHYISGAWGPSPKEPVTYRRDMWLQHYYLQKQLVDQYRHAGHTQVGVGDFNRATFDKFTAGQRWIDNQQIDKSYWVPGGNGSPTLRVQGVHMIRDSAQFYYTDHAPTWVQADLVLP